MEAKKTFVSDVWAEPDENSVMSSKLICHFLTNRSQYHKFRAEKTWIVLTLLSKPEL